MNPELFTYRNSHDERFGLPSRSTVHAFYDRQRLPPRRPERVQPGHRRSKFDQERVTTSFELGSKNCLLDDHRQVAIKFGTSFGISTVYLACAIRDNGGGKVSTTEFESTEAAKAMENLASVGLAEYVDCRSGDARETLRSDLRMTIDIVMLGWGPVHVRGSAGESAASSAFGLHRLQ